MTSPHFTARDAAIAVLSALTAAAIALLIHLPHDAKPADFLAIAGTFLGAAIAIGGSLLVISRQAEQSEKRHHRTADVLLEDIVERGWVLEQIVSNEGITADNDGRLRGLLASTPFSLRAAANALDRMRIESPALAQIAQVGEVWVKAAAEIEELVQYASSDILRQCYDSFQNCAENARRCRGRLDGEPFASGTIRRRITGG